MSVIIDEFEASIEAPRERGSGDGAAALGATAAPSPDAAQLRELLLRIEERRLRLAAD